MKHVRYRMRTWKRASDSSLRSAKSREDSTSTLLRAWSKMSSCTRGPESEWDPAPTEEKRKYSPNGTCRRSTCVSHATTGLNGAQLARLPAQKSRFLEIL